MWSKKGKLDFCEHRVFKKQYKMKFSIGVHGTKGTVDYIHSDLWGPSQVPSKSGLRYMLNFVDDYSRKVQEYFLKQKSNVFEKFKLQKTMIEKQTKKSIQCLRIDNELEFCSDEFNHFCNEHGIVRHHTCENTIAEWHSRANEKNSLGESSMYAVKCRSGKRILG